MKTLTTLALLLCFSPIFPQLLIADVITVGKSGADYSTISAAFNSHNLEPGDVIEIIDSNTYSENVTWGSNDGGSSGNNVVLRAQSGQTPTIEGYIFIQNLSYCQIGDEGHGTITIDPTTTGWIDGAIELTNGDNCTLEYTTITDVYDGCGIMLNGGSDNNTIQYCTIYQIGTSYLAAGSQGSGINLYRNANYNIIQNNTVYDCAHDQIIIEATGDGDRTNLQYNQILNNYINSEYGIGIELLWSQYNLIDGNRIYNIGNTVQSMGKPAIELSGARNSSVRRNIIYNGYQHYAFEISAYNRTMFTNDNYIYNNTVHTWGSSGSNSLGGNSAVINSDSVAAAENSGNKYYNNIFWYVNDAGQNGWAPSEYQLCIANWYYTSGAADDWGDNLTQVNASSCGDCEFKNNLFRSQAGSGYGQVFGYLNHGNSYQQSWSASGMNTDLDCASGNIDADPSFTDTPSGNLSATDTWWHLKSGSPCIDTGIVINDPNASNGGWSQLTYNGTAPDIGAYESGGTPDEPPLPPSGLRIVTE
jgi:hypothetical protein